MLRSPDNSLSPTSALVRQHALILEACSKIERRADPGVILKETAEAAGFVNVVEYRLPVPLGGWAKDPTYKEIGRLNWHALYDGLEAITMRPLTGVLGWSVEEVKILLADVKKELFDKSIHAEYTLYVHTSFCFLLSDFSS